LFHDVKYAVTKVHELTEAVIYEYHLYFLKFFFCTRGFLWMGLCMDKVDWSEW